MVMTIVCKVAAINRHARVRRRATLPSGLGRRKLGHQPKGRLASPRCAPGSAKEAEMPESVYKVIELVGTSTESWEKAATAAVERASKTLRDLRVAEVVQQDLVIEDGKVRAYRAKVNVSFKYED
jgi:dodecin